MKLEGKPEIYHRVVELTTRPKRPEETDGFDYKFITDEQFELIKKHCFETVETQFAPAKYGGEFSQLKEDKINVIVASIEGFLSGIKHSSALDNNILVNIINDVPPDVERENRDYLFEEKFNLSVLKQFLHADFHLNVLNRFCNYFEIKLSKLKEIRDYPDELFEYFEKNILKTAIGFSKFVKEN